MLPAAVQRFSGTFKNLETYSMDMNAVARDRGISSERLAALAQTVRQTFDGVKVTCQPYNSPTALTTYGHNRQAVQSADAFINTQFKQNNVAFEYEP